VPDISSDQVPVFCFVQVSGPAGLRRLPSGDAAAPGLPAAELLAGGQEEAGLQAGLHRDQPLHDAVRQGLHVLGVPAGAGDAARAGGRHRRKERAAHWTTGKLIDLYSKNKRKGKRSVHIWIRLEAEI
jgi:hypothetical protein